MKLAKIGIPNATLPQVFIPPESALSPHCEFFADILCGCSNSPRAWTPYVELSASGFYFNEIAGSLSGAPLNLTALVDLRDGATVNVNVLTHLEKPRVAYLFQSGLTLGQAKAQAQQEILALFNLQNTIPENAETLDISQAGEGNAMLLAISILLQGDRSEAQLTELLSIISGDIRTDGVLDNSDVEQTLLEAMESMKPRLDAIRDNIVNRYTELGESVTVPPFEDFLFALDTVPPAVASTSPEEGSDQNVQAITVTFSEWMDHDTLTGNTVILHDATNTVIAGSISISNIEKPDDRVATRIVFTPDAELAPGAYTLTIDSAVTDFAGLSLPSQFVLNFTHSSGVTAISAGYTHNCAVTTLGGVKCWGWIHGILGDGQLTSGIKAVAAGESHTCALTDAGGVKCWGSNSVGQLGNGTQDGGGIEPVEFPVDVIGLSSGVQAIAAGSNFTCAITDAGGVKCWGANDRSQLGNGTQQNSSTPVDVTGLSSGLQAIATGHSHACALTDAGGVKCWGSNQNGQVGNPHAVETATYQPPSIHPYPVDAVELSSGVQAIAAGYHHSCAVMETGSVKCWGGYQLPTIQTVPTEIVGLPSEVKMVAAGGSEDGTHTCFLHVDGYVTCLGNNLFGQLGNGEIDWRNNYTPGYVIELPGAIESISAAHNHTCVLAAIGGARCWGANSHGQLGSGPHEDSPVPLKVANLSLDVPVVTPPTLPPPGPGEGDEDMILIPGGTFYMGCDLDDPATADLGCQCEHGDELECDDNFDFPPPQTVEVEPFYIDKYPVTNARYAACVQAGHCFGPPLLQIFSRTREYYYGNPEYDDYPLVWADLYTARTFCEWAGKRLPTSEEWELAARGVDDQRVFPWGNDFPNPNLANYGLNVGDTTAVGSYPNGASPYGVMDMAGNVWEWVESEPLWEHDPKNELRGGSFISGDIGVNSVLRFYQYGDEFRNSIGFRCARFVE